MLQNEIMSLIFQPLLTKNDTSIKLKIPEVTILALRKTSDKLINFEENLQNPLWSLCIEGELNIYKVPRSCYRFQ
jgi:hypothetical protein